MEHERQIAKSQRKGRAATRNLPNRFESLQTVGIYDGWGLDEELPVLRTEVTEEKLRRAISRNSSPDLHFDRSINPYRGCEHGCVYCFARPSHAYLGLSAGLDFETRLIARPNAAAQLRRELSAPRYAVDTMAIGTNTDAYQPIEKTRGITRDILRVLSEFRHPVVIVTKGTLIERDIDILSEMASEGLAAVAISVTTLDPQIARVMEPRVPSPIRRLKAIETLSNAGIPVRVFASPMIPGLTDPELETILTAGKEAGAKGASAIALRLPREVAPLFKDWLAEHFPDRQRKVMSLVRQMHGGRDYDPEFGTRMTGTGVYAKLLRDRFDRACRALGLEQRPSELRRDLFHVPVKPGDQLSLF